MNMRRLFAAFTSVIVALGSVLSATFAEDSILFVRIPNKPGGRPGIHYEPFMMHFGRSAHVPGAQIVRLSPPKPDGTLVVLTKDFFAVDEPELSWDGKKILFAGKKTKQSGWEVWEMNVDGSGKRQITRGMADVCSPHYLPDGRIIFSSTRHVAMKPERRRDEYDRDYARLAHRCNADGTEVEQLTFNLSSDSEFIVMRDGRVLFQSWQHHGIRFHTSGLSAFFTMNPDGTGFLDFWGNHFGGFRWKQREMPDGRIVFIDSVFHHAYGGGQLAMIDPGDPDDRRRLEILTPDVKKYGPQSKGGRYRDPYPTQDGRLLVVWSPPPAWSGYRNPKGPKVQFGIYWFDLQARRLGQPVYNDPAYQALNPIFVESRPVPRVIPDHTDRAQKTGTLLCLNAYLGQTDKEARIRPGQIKKVRIIEGFGIHPDDPFFRTLTPGIGYSSFGSSCNSISNFEQKRVVGEAPVAEDGSFYVKVPSDTVLHWQVLDENDMALQDATTWAWVRPGEHRVCIGCHEHRTTIPDLAKVPLAAKKGPVDLATPPEKRKTVDFRRDLVPIIEKKCTRCHNEDHAEAGLDLSHGDRLEYIRVGAYRTGAMRLRAALFNRAYLNLSKAASGRLGKYIHPGSARRSPLIWRLYGKSFLYDAPVNRCPPDEPLSDQEKRLFALWVDLGAQWDNLPGPDPYLSFDPEKNKELARQDAARVGKELVDPVVATDVRCGECHAVSRALALRQSPAEWKRLVETMAAKRQKWIRPAEVARIASHLSRITEQDGTIRFWRVCGPFENAGAAGIRTRYPPETSIDFRARYSGKGNQKATWKEVTVTDPTGVLNLKKVFRAGNGVTAYAYAEIVADRDRTVAMRVTADDMFELFVNGKKVLQRLVQQPFEYDKDVFPVRLRKGSNVILVKVHQFYGPWRLRLRLTEDLRPASPAAAGVRLVKPEVAALRRAP